MRKILYLASTLARCGPVNQLFDLVSRLDPERYLPVVMTLSPEPADTRLPDFQEVGIKTTSLGLGRIEGLLCARSSVAHLADAERFEIVHSQGIRSDILLSSLGGARTVSTIHNYPLEDYKLTYGLLKGWAMAHVHMHAVHRLNAVVGVSDAVRQDLVCNFGIKDAAAILNGIDTDKYVPATPEEKRELRSKLNLAPDAVIWVSSGTLSARKDPLTLIRSWNAAVRPTERKTLVLLGDGPLMEKCRQMAVGNSTVVLAGHVDNVSEYLRAADGLVSSSVSEGIGLAVLEALATGLPIILADNPAYREIWTANPDVVSLFPAGDDKALTHLLDREAQLRGPNTTHDARQTALSCFSARQMSLNYMNLYDRLLGERRA